MSAHVVQGGKGGSAYVVGGDQPAGQKVTSENRIAAAIEAHVESDPAHDADSISLDVEGLDATRVGAGLVELAASLAGLDAGDVGAVPTSDVGEPDGVASLDAEGRVSPGQESALVRVRSPRAVAWDGFDRPDQSGLGTADSGHSWGAVGGRWDISDGIAQEVGLGVNRFAELNITPLAAMRVSGWLRLENSAGLLLRGVQSGGDNLHLQLTTTILRLSHRGGGSTTVLAEANHNLPSGVWVFMSGIVTADQARAECGDAVVTATIPAAPPDLTAGLPGLYNRSAFPVEFASILVEDMT